MKKRNIKRAIWVALIITGVSGIFALSGALQGEAGSDQDPVVTLSYVEKRIQDVFDTLNPKISALESREVMEKTDTIQVVQPTPVEQVNTGTSPKYEVVFVEKGKFVYCGASTELILRGGKANAIASANGGLADLTVGRDIQSGEIIPDNHLLLIARDDGRGVAVLEDAWIMIKGDYSIVE